MVERLCQEYGIKAIYAFGSRASETQAVMEGSATSFASGAGDADIAILSEFPLSLNDKVRLVLALEDILNISPVDLVTLNDADPFLAANVIRGERLYVHDPYEADEYELFVLRRAGDLAELERERMALILKESAYDAG
jgi:predicted nucleotidyltransferase